MKKNLFIVLMLAAITTGVFAQSGVIRDLSGEVELKRAGASSFTAARTGDQVAQDTIISTGFKSTAVIEIGSSLITVRPLTRLSLAEIRSEAGSENVSVNLQAGRVRVDVTPPAGTRANTTIQSPSATASVRGTSFEFDTLNLKVLEGTVSFGGNVGTDVMVRAGGESYVQTDGKTVDPFDISKANLLPQAPVGTPEVMTGLPVNSTGEISIIVEFPAADPTDDDR